MTRYEFSIKNRPRLAKPYHFVASGLPNVYLLNGVTIEKDPDYGRLVTIEKLDDLHRAIALSVVMKAEALTGGEMRFLRKEMGLTQAELARRLRVNHQTVANYEKGKTERGAADTAVRLLYLAHTAPGEHVAELSRWASGSRPAEKKLGTAIRNKLAGGWSDAELLRA